MSDERSRVAILGCGAVGLAFACSLAARGAGGLDLWSRSSRPLHAWLARGAPARLRRRAKVHDSAADAARGAAVVLLCVSDEVVGRLAAALGRELGATRRASVVLIASGFVPLPRPGRSRRTLHFGRLHPLAPVLSGTSPALRGAPFAIEGDAVALRAARSLVRRLDGHALRLAGGARAAAAYHAGAALLGGGLVALFALAEATMKPGLRATTADLRRALHSFCAANADNARRQGPRRALTGPVARGSRALVRGHLRALAGIPGAREAYGALGWTMLRLACERGSLDARTAKELGRLLDRAARPTRGSR